MKKKNSLLKILKWMGIIIALIFSLVVITSFRIWHFGTQDERQQVDAIIVLGAAAWHNNPSPVFLERIRHGIWLYEENYADIIIFTGGYGTGAQYSESYVARNYAIEAGIDPNSILIEEHSRNTADHFSYAMELIENYNIRTVLLVSDPLHMLRARSMARSAGLIAYSSPTPTTRYQSFSTQFPFLRSEVIYYIGYQIMRLFK